MNYEHNFSLTIGKANKKNVCVTTLQLYNGTLMHQESQNHYNSFKATDANAKTMTTITTIAKTYRSRNQHEIFFGKQKQRILVITIVTNS